MSGVMCEEPQNVIELNLMADADVATYCRNIKKPDGTPVPGIVIPFTTTIEHSKNFFGLPLAAGDHAYTPSNFATKIDNVGIALPLPYNPGANDFNL